MSVRIHASAEVSDKAHIGDGTSIWHHCQVREGVQLGKNCILQGITIITMEDLYRLQSGSWIKGMRANRSWHLSN